MPDPFATGPVRQLTKSEYEACKRLLVLFTSPKQGLAIFGFDPVELIAWRALLHIGYVAELPMAKPGPSEITRWTEFQTTPNGTLWLKQVQLTENIAKESAELARALETKS